MLKKNVNRILSILLALGLLVSLGISGMAANSSPQGEDASVELVFLGNGGTPESQTVQMTIGARFAEAFEQITIPTREYVMEFMGMEFIEAYIFIGWFTTPRGDGVKIHGTDYIIEYQDTLESPRTIYARWREPVYPHHLYFFCGNGGTPMGQMINHACIVGRTFAEAFAMLEEPTKQGHAFLGWYAQWGGDPGMRGPDHLICSTQGFFAGEFRASWLLWGDANGDGRVDSQDLGLIQRHLNFGHLISVQRDVRAADVVFDGRVDSSDLALLQRFLNVGHLIPIELGLPPR